MSAYPLTQAEALKRLDKAVSTNYLSEIKRFIWENKFLSTKVDAMRDAVHTAICTNSNGLDALKILLSRGLFSNSAFSEFLRSCITYSQLEMIKYLIIKGVNVCRPYSSTCTPLSVALTHGNTEIIELLLNNGARFIINSELLVAVYKSNSEIVELLLQKGAFPNFQNIEGLTPLIQALNKCTVDLEIVEKLVKKGADVNLSTSKGTPLTIAVNSGVPEVVDFLVRNQADVNCSDENGDYPVMRAIEMRNNEIVKILIENNAKLDIVDENGDTVFIKAVRLSNREIVKYLIEHGEDVNQTDRNGLCALSVALSEDDFYTFDLLIRSGANADLASESIKTKARKNSDFAYLMLEMKKNRNDEGLSGQEAL